MADYIIWNCASLSGLLRASQNNWERRGRKDTGRAAELEAPAQAGRPAARSCQRVQKFHGRTNIAVAFFTILCLALYVQWSAKIDGFEFLEEPRYADRSLA